MATKVINTSEIEGIKPFLKKLSIPTRDSHKGQNGKILVIGGSSLFHSASIWAAEIASYIVDMVFYSSVEENNEIVREAKTKFHNGIVVRQVDIEHYIEEADSILIGPGMMRSVGPLKPTEDYNLKDLGELSQIEHEGVQTYYLTKYILKKYPKKKFVLDAGALQMMKPDWLLKLSQHAILTPHKEEFVKLFGKDSIEDCAKKYHCTILNKGKDDVIANNAQIFTVQGGNQGLTKGGTGDLLAGLAAALYAKNDSMTAAILASFLLKKSADRLQLTKGYWYNVTDLIDEIPKMLTEISNL